MAQLLLIKDANMENKEVDDIIGIFKDTHRFSDDEHFLFNIQKVEGYTQEELITFAQNKLPERPRIYRLKVANEWTFDVPEMEDAWKHTDGKWYMVVEAPKYHWTIKNMTPQERTILASGVSSSLDKLNTLSHLESKMCMNIKNMVEITELNE